MHAPLPSDRGAGAGPPLALGLLAALASAACRAPVRLARRVGLLAERFRDEDWPEFRRPDPSPVQNGRASWEAFDEEGPELRKAFTRLRQPSASEARNIAQLQARNARLQLENEMLRNLARLAQDAPWGLSATAYGARSDADAAAGAGVPPPEADACTTLILRNVPLDFSRDELLSLLDREGFAGQYNLVFLPIDFNSKANFGYAFVTLSDRQQAEALWSRFEGFSQWPGFCRKVCTVEWATPAQGLDAHVERFRNSPVMHASVPDEYKPVLFQRGVRVQFPAPTHRLRVPKPMRT